ncbi:RidA family protein [Pseudoxanthomonas sp. Root65]|uniref:RidA family protein n=1 Tax=Pseudoxanthomonas sp. Root65 TaxID=1736576 RepID=UPI0009EAA11D|nr:RidA family protein [Pseudoxanthomonas sp. Root65]
MSLRSVGPANLWDSSPYLFSQVVLADEPKRFAFISGQVALSADGSLVGEGDVDAQLRQIFANLRAALAGVGGTLNDIATMTLYVKDVAYHRNYMNLQREEFEGWRPSETLVQVAALALPEFLIEIQAVAVLRSRSS